MANEQETALDAAILELKTQIAAAADRVIKKLEDLGKDRPELSDEISDITAAVETIKGIAPDAP